MCQVYDLEPVKRTQRDYTLSFKLQVVGEIERGELSLRAALRKYGIQSGSSIRRWIDKYGKFDRSHQISMTMSQTPEQKIMELEQQVKLLEKQKAFLEKQVETADKKAIIFDMMIDLAEQEYKIDIRKNSLPEQLPAIEKKNKKQ